MKHYALILALALNASSAFAGNCRLLIPSDDAKFGESEIAAFVQRGYSVTRDNNAFLEGALSAMTGTNCTTYLGLWESCTHTVQIGRPIGNGVSFTYPVEGKTLLKAINKLPTCM